MGFIGKGNGRLIYSLNNNQYTHLMCIDYIFNRAVCGADINMNLQNHSVHADMMYFSSHSFGYSRL